MKIDYRLMQNICLSPIKTFKGIGDVTTTRDGIYIYKNNPNAKILAVAHLDSVLNLKHFHKMTIDNSTYVVNAQLDDRLGAYVLLDLLPQLGIEYDLLLTEGEERGRSTGAYFHAAKSYNWMFSFDRRLDDVVTYQYGSKELHSDLQRAKFWIGNGSFSDISLMDHLGIRGFNVGTGYSGEHSKFCYADMDMLIKQIQRFKVFYNTFKDKQYPYEQDQKMTWQNARYTSDRFVQAAYDDICYICGNPSPDGDDYEGVWICGDCLGNVAQCAGCDDIILDTELTDNLCAYCRGESKALGM